MKATQTERTYPRLVAGFDLECIESAWQQASHCTLCVMATVNVSRATHVTGHRHQVLNRRRPSVVLRVLCYVHNSITTTVSVHCAEFNNRTAHNQEVQQITTKK